MMMVPIHQWIHTSARTFVFLNVPQLATFLFMVQEHSLSHLYFNTSQDLVDL